MASNLIQHFTKLFVPQTTPARADQIKNNAGGYAFALDPWKRLERFLILGCDGGSYYAGERAMTIENAAVLRECLDLDGRRALHHIVSVSDEGRAPKNDAALFALALAASHPDPATRQAALAALPKVCRTGTQLFRFARDVQGFRRWGRGLRGAVAAWYNALDADRLSAQVCKYQQRDGVSHRDLLRLAHPKGRTPAHNAIFRFVAGGGSAALANDTRRGEAPKVSDLPEYLVAFEELTHTTKKAAVLRLIRQHRFTHEMVPSPWKNDRDVWDALLEDMPTTALLRHLGKLTAVGVLGELSDRAVLVAAHLTAAPRLRKARVHPLSILLAQKVYAQGHGEKGKLTWKPAGTITDALEQAFHQAFLALEPSNKRHLLALDVSASMSWGDIAGMSGITPRLASAAMAMVTARTEQASHLMGFSSHLVPLGITPQQSLAQVVATIDKVPMGGTDCSLPMRYALENKIEVDTFVVYTDNETYAGKIHPFEALRQYRRALNPKAKLVVVGMTATRFTIADPSDAGMLDIVGFDTSAPAIMAAFSGA